MLYGVRGAQRKCPWGTNAPSILHTIKIQTHIIQIG